MLARQQLLRCLHTGFCAAVRFDAVSTLIMFALPSAAALSPISFMFSLPSVVALPPLSMCLRCGLLLRCLQAPCVCAAVSRGAVSTLIICA